VTARVARSAGHRCSIGYERTVIMDYHNLVSGLRDHDVITHRLLAEILAAKRAREDDSRLR
jgi:hypothetical protein